MNNADFLRWDPDQEDALRIFSHFVMSRTEDSSSAVLHDALLPLASALNGLDTTESSKWFWKIGGIGLPPSVAREDLLAQCLRLFEAISETSVRNVVASTTFSLREHRTFSQGLREEGKYRIDVWLPASAACAYLSLFLSHLGLVLYLEAEQVPESKIAPVRERTNHFLLVMRMAAQAVADGGTSVLQNFDIEPALPQAVQAGLDMFVATICFNVFHELAHVVLGHHRDRESGVAVDKHAQEFQADEFALTFLSGLDFDTPNVAFMGALIALLSSSMMTPGPDSASSKSHPSLVSRYRRLCDRYDEVCELEPGTTRRSFKIYIANALGNMFDRDRCPCWLGQDRRAALGLAPDFEFNEDRIDYSSAGATRVIDKTRALVKTRKLDISDEDGSS